MSPQLVILLLVLIGSAVVVHFMSRRNRERLNEYWQRRCEGRAWRRTFPNASADDIRRFLHIFTDALGFPNTRQLQFAPTDRLMAVYHAVSPPGWPDALELETLDRSLHKTYGIALRDVWKETLTLGDLFAQAHRPA